MAKHMEYDYGGFGDLLERWEGLAGSGQAGMVGGASTLLVVYIDNTANTGAACYFTAYDHAAPTFGTTEPDLCLPCLAGLDILYDFSPFGLKFDTDFSCMVSTAKAGSAATDPTNDVNVKLLLDT